MIFFSLFLKAEGDPSESTRPTIEKILEKNYYNDNLNLHVNFAIYMQ